MQGRERSAGCPAEQTDTSLWRWSLSLSQPSTHTVVKEGGKKKKTLGEQQASVPEWPGEFAQRLSLCNARTGLSCARESAAAHLCITPD